MPGIDRISELPEHLITQILLCLPTKDSVKTSVLSTRWKNLWLTVPGLDLNSHDFPCEYYEQLVMFINFMDGFLGFNRESRLQKFVVDHSRHEVLGFKDRISIALNRGIRILDVVSTTQYLEDDDGSNYPFRVFMPLNLFTSKTLVSLKLSFSGLGDPGFVSMPCLKSMILREIRLSGTMTLEKLVSGCPVLEELILIRDFYGDELVVTHVRSRSLKTTLKEDHYDRIMAKNLTSLFMIDFFAKIGTSFDPEDLSKRDEICDFLTGISSARHMIISQKTVKALDLYSKVGSIPKFKNLSCLQAAFPRPLLPFLPIFLESFPNLKHLILDIGFATEETVKALDLYSKVGSIPKFKNLSRLQVAFPRPFLPFLPTFLENFPNLKHLILDIGFATEETEELKLVNVPQSFVSTLECVEIKELLQWEEEHMKLASYFLENSSVLKKLIVSFFIDYPRYASKSDVYEYLDKLTKRSPRCQIIVIVVDD